MKMKIMTHIDKNVELIDEYLQRKKNKLKGRNRKMKNIWFVIWPLFIALFMSVMIVTAKTEIMVVTTFLVSQLWLMLATIINYLNKRK